MTVESLYRLAEQTAIEPLIDRWVAWPHIFSPAPYCLHLLNYQTKVLSSYLQAPEVHFKSARNPKLMGGPFVNASTERAAEVRDLLNHLMETHRDDLELARSLIEFQNQLTEEAKGQSLEPYYEKIPEALQGYVELVYDYNNHPIVRCLESLLYHSPYYKTHIQSLCVFRQLRDDSRAYFMSTPRLSERDQIDWIIPFADPQLDQLFNLDLQPQPLGYIREILRQPVDDETLIPLLSKEPNKIAEQWSDSGIRFRYFGHACVLTEWNGVSILIDPFISVVPEDGGIDRFTYTDLPPQIDYVLITHAHHDHFVLETLIRLRHRIRYLIVPRSSGIFYGDTSLKLLAQKIGFKHIQEVDALESISVPSGDITAVPFLGEHNDLPHAKTAYVVRAGKEQILFAADSSCLDKRVYEHIRNVVGPIRTVFVGMECIGAPLSWVYGPLLPKPPEHAHSQSRRSHACDAVGALHLLHAVGAERVYVYAMGREPWLQSSLAFVPEENDLYMKESTKVLETCRVRGFVDAQRLFGRRELYLGGM